MKKVLFIFALFFSISTFAQGDLYLIFELMKVDNEQENVYWETETFWEKIHQQRVQSGDIIGWDLWALPSGEDQGYQYMTVTLFDSAKAMFEGGNNMMESVKKAYPNMSDDELNKTFNNTSKTRDLAVRIFLHEIATTKDSFDMPLGTVAYLNFMKVDLDHYADYEKAEMEVFQPMHQQEVDNGTMASWGLLRYMLPYGSEVYASHIAVDMYKDIDQALSRNAGGDMNDLTPAQQKAIQDGLATRDLKMGNMATLVKKVR